MAFERLVKKITLENLWLYIIKMLMERPMYAYEISKVLTERFGFSAAMVTVYVVLYKMRREGLIRKVGENSYRGRPNRKYYEVTSKGKESFSKGRTFLKKVASTLS